MPDLFSQTDITKVFCEQCGTTMFGQFGSTGSRFSKLAEEQMEFLMVFIRFERKFNRIEEILNLSYPTLRNRFNDILAAMGFEGANPMKNIRFLKIIRLRSCKNWIRER